MVRNKLKRRYHIELGVDNYLHYYYHWGVLSTPGLTKGVMFICIILFSIFSAQAQSEKSKIIFDEKSFDFGDVKEEDGMLTHEFKFHNQGNTSFTIQNVETSCGCTQPFIRDSTVNPGDSGVILARFDITNRPGRFEKSLSVYGNKVGPESILTISGYVIPTPENIEEEFPVAKDEVRFTTETINFGKINTKGIKRKRFGVFNASMETKTIRVKWVPDHIKIGFDSVQLDVNKRSEFTIAFDPVKKNSLGPNSDAIIINVGDQDQTIRVKSFIEEYLGEVTPENMQNAPKLFFENSSFSFEPIRAGLVVQHDFTFQNTGKSTLKLKTTKSNCACVSATLGQKEIAPGDSGTISVTFDTTDRSGNQYMPIAIFSNDLENPSQVILMMGKILSP